MGAAVPPGQPPSFDRNRLEALKAYCDAELDKAFEKDSDLQTFEVYLANGRDYPRDRRLTIEELAEFKKYFSSNWKIFQRSFRGDQWCLFFKNRHPGLESRVLRLDRSTWEKLNFLAAASGTTPRQIVTKLANSYIRRKHKDMRGKDR